MPNFKWCDECLPGLGKLIEKSPPTSAERSNWLQGLETMIDKNDCEGQGKDCDLLHLMRQGESAKKPNKSP